MSIKFATVGKGGTVHGTTDETTTLCGKPVAKMVNIPGATVACGNCNKQSAKLDTPNNNEENTTVAAKNTETKPTADEIAAEVTKDVENIIDVLSTLTKTDADKITAAQAQANAELMKVSANKRAGLSMRLKEAVAAAQGRSTTVLIKAETAKVEDIENYAEIIDHTAARVAEGIKSEVSAQETAKTVASAIFDGRLRVFDKKGRPDIKGTRQASKDLSTAIYNKAAEQLLAENYGSDVADVDELLKGLKDKVQYQMTAVIPSFIYALDNSPEQFAELFPALVSEVSEENKASDLVFNLYGVNRKSKAELAAERRAAAKELKEREERGELTAGEGEGDEETEGEGNGAAEKTQFEKDKAKLTKLPKDLTALVEHSKDFTDEEKTEARKLITDALTQLSDALNKL